MKREFIVMTQITKNNQSETKKWTEKVKDVKLSEIKCRAKISCGI